MRAIGKFVCMLLLVAMLSAVNVILRGLTEFYYPIDLSWIVGTWAIIRFISNYLDKELAPELTDQEGRDK